MVLFRRWPENAPPNDDGIVVVVLHRHGRSTLIVAPAARAGRPHPDLELETTAALRAAERQAETYRLSTVYVAVNDAAPWNPDWGELRD
jgi:hypothetical protein